MQRIALIQSRPGMVLAQAVCRPDGLVLVGEGLTLTDTVIGRIRAAGIGMIWVEGNPLGAGGSVGDLKAIADGLPYLFRRQKDNVFMMTLYSVLARHFARRITEQRALEDEIVERGRNGKAEDGGVPGNGRADT